MELTIHVIVPAGSVPHIDDFDPDDIPAALNNELRPEGTLTATAVQIAERLLPKEKEQSGSLSAPERYLLWNAFAEALANLCRKPQTDSSPAVVASVDGLLWTDEEFSLSLYRQTESLDLEHLSPPLPSESGGRPANL